METKCDSSARGKLQFFPLFWADTKEKRIDWKLVKQLVPREEPFPRQADIVLASQNHKTIIG